METWRNQAAVVMSADDKSMQFQQSSVWCFVSGVTGRGVSVVAADGKHYLYHKGYQLFAAPLDMIKNRGDATFRMRDALTGGGKKDDDNFSDESSDAGDSVDAPGDSDDAAECGYPCIVKGKGTKVKEKTLQKYFKKSQVENSVECMCGEYCSSENFAMWYVKSKPGKKGKPDKNTCFCYSEDEETAVKKSKKAGNTCSVDPKSLKKDKDGR